MKRLFLPLTAVFSLFAGRASAQTPFDSCGTMIPSAPCTMLFQDTNNNNWLLSNNGGFQIGDQVHVIGTVPPLCFTLCSAGCLTVAVITPCIINPGTPFCFGDGTGTACPCANASPVGANRGCLNSTGNSGQLLATGAPSISADTLLLNGDGMPNGPALYFQGTTQLSGGSGVVFGDGLRCIGGTTVRLGIRTNVSGASSFPPVGNPTLSVSGGAAVGSVVRYQLWYRDSAAFCTTSTFNLTNALEITWLN